MEWKALLEGPGVRANKTAKEIVDSFRRHRNSHREGVLKRSPKEIGQWIRSTLIILCMMPLAFTYIPTLAITGSGRRQACNHAEIVHNPTADGMTTPQGTVFARRLLTLMDTIFFCEDVVSAQLLCLSALSGAIFGGIHCLAWNFTFPSDVEQILWRASSSVISGICVCVAVAALLNNLQAFRLSLLVKPKGLSDHSILNPRVSGVSYIEGVVCMIFAFCFLLSRLSLLTLSVAQFRDLPASAYHAVEWLKIFPHI